MRTSQRTIYFEIVVFVTLAVVCSIYVVRTVGGPDPLGGSFGVVVEMEHATGMPADSEVSYRGVSVGKVDSVVLGDPGDPVELHVRIRHSARIPADATAAINQDAAAPVLKLELESDATAGPYLEDGAVIPGERTSVPVPFGEVLANFDALARTLDPDDLRVLSHELGVGFDGNTTDFATLVDDFSTIVRTLDTNQVNIRSLVDDSRVLFDENEDGIRAIPTIAQSLREITEQIRLSDPSIRTLLDHTPTILADQVSPLLRENQQSLAVLMANSSVSTRIVASRMPAVNALLVAVPNGFTALGSVVRDGRARLDLVTQVGPVCFYDTPRRSVQDTSPRELDRDRHCTDESGRVQQRGSQNVPRTGVTPVGDETGPVPAEPADQVAVTVYDPATGVRSAGDGSTVRIGGSGGQQQILGDRSWVALLLQGAQ
ncbi:MCE family protein [Rhodococcus triatomae]|uniref:Phospholipid/cholesterol/gamma-HCH transport system substrate-binding protein n=1 Tax=Rhodococcus triatomae TaxID=300028 RepID=A0A1G7ZSQ9_9NOCA|nr:MlaD family protein [Rhodococcus triatomae]QNG17960.1 MCE family protein [Rhodococcus triatomae]QNG22372.1 MCE family protein [Rhodococcus triatomae]SDH11714.1 phospholipid/cholesterol/gamma-HCH transport system substrate-binding protein [Rhodococcus triatomae]